MLGVAGAGLGPTPDNMINNTKLSSLEETRSEFNPGQGAIKLGIDVHQDYYVVAAQVEAHALYEACGFGFGLQRQLSTLGIHCYVVSPQKLDERHERVKTDGRDAQGALFEAGSLRPGQPGDARGHPDPKQPGYFIKRPYATRRAESIHAGHAVLTRAAGLHPTDATIQFNLACYEAQMGSLDRAKAHLKRATKIDPQFSLMALDEPDLQPLRTLLANS